MQNRKNNIHGYISVILFFISCGIGVVSIAYSSLLFGLLDILVIGLAFVIIAITYCSKCKCRESCNHWIFGKISILFSKSNTDKYTSFDLLITLISMGVVLALPQYWLLKIPFLFFSYWIVLAIAFFEILFFVCNKCENDKCSMCRNKQIAA